VVDVTFDRDKLVKAIANGMSEWFGNHSVGNETIADLIIHDLEEELIEEEGGFKYGK
jgi:hypothetical protein